jgi:hypothetical protein
LALPAVAVPACLRINRRAARPIFGDRSAAAPLEPRVDGLALEGEHAEHALVHAAQRLAADEAVERLDAEGEHAQRERALWTEMARAQALEVRGLGVSASTNLLSAQASTWTASRSAAKTADSTSPIPSRKPRFIE